jgi:monofunctional biosynthetic peptidoglycan transglycosylase
MSDFRAPLDHQPAAAGGDNTTVRTATVRTGPTSPETEPVIQVKRQTVWSYIKAGLRIGFLLLLGYVALVVALVIAYRWINPPTTTLIAMQRAVGTSISRTWVPIERISPNLQRAVVMSEDARFCTHGGIDWREIEEAFDRSQDGVVRGGSTISMQVAKNLFLWPSKSYVRKALEIPITYGMEQLWPKRRILEIYLNIAEWGPGIFGAEAAAQHHFRKPAWRLTETEAALLAVSLPNPILRDAAAPTPGTRRLAQIIQTRMRSAGPYVKCLPGA